MFKQRMLLMPYMKNGKRDYQREDKLYESRPEQVKNREDRNKARHLEEKAGRVHKGDGMDVDHTRPISKGGKTTPGNLRVVTQTQNRSFSRNKDGSLKSQRSKQGK